MCDLWCFFLFFFFSLVGLVGHQVCFFFCDTEYQFHVLTFCSFTLSI